MRLTGALTLVSTLSTLSIESRSRELFALITGVANSTRATKTNKT